MKGLVIAIVSVLVLSLSPAQADQGEDRALLAQAQQTGLRFYAAINGGDSKAVQSYLLSYGEARAYFRAYAEPRAYNAWIARTWHEIKELKALETQHQLKGSAVAFAGFHFVSWQRPVGPNILRPTLVITARPVFNVNGKKVMGGDTVRLVRINNYWKIGSVLD